MTATYELHDSWSNADQSSPDSVLNTALHVLAIPLVLAAPAEQHGHIQRAEGAEGLASHEQAALSEVFNHSRFLAMSAEERSSLDVGFGALDLVASFT